MTVTTLERKLNGIDAKCGELLLTRKYVQHRTNSLSVEALTAVVVDRHPGAAFIELMMISEYDDREVPWAIFDDSGWPLWRYEMIGPKRPEDQLFEDRIAKYGLQLGEGVKHEYLVLPEEVHDIFYPQYAGDGVDGITILS